ncbi:MAG: DUF2264 domain-containing protein [Niabella sp.]
MEKALQQKRVPNQPLFKIDNPDYKLSPKTGITREHWKQMGLYLLRGAFSYIDNIDDPMQFPKEPGKSYPRSVAQVPTEKLEGLSRTLFIAAPLLKEDSNLVLHNIRVADYYRHQILNLLNPQSQSYIKPQEKGGGPSQILVEFGALAVSLFYAPEVLFDPLSKEQKDLLAHTMLSYGDGKTVGSNWKFFNIFVLSFFKMKGYAVNEKLLVEYLDKSLEHYRGSGWYNDAPAYDYYSMWAFQMYGPLWTEYFGKKYYPVYAEKFLKNFDDLKATYPYMFSKDGEMIVWGRSMTYRIGSVVPFALMGLQNDPKVNYGWMRRIASGVMKQFLTHPDFLKDNVPTLGVYGSFEPAVQPYSCRGSVYWMGKAFFALMLPKDSPFWTATENDGAWDTEMKKGRVYNHFADTANILVTDYPNIGASEIRAWCKVKLIGAWETFRASENYNRLSYNSAFPWQADSVEGVISMNYIIKNAKNEWEPLRLYDFKNFDNGIYYREAVLETNPHIKLKLADMPLPNGILRIDKVGADVATELRLGHYALPDLKGAIKTTKKKVKGKDVVIIDNGIYQLAMINYEGWDKIYDVDTRRVHPQSEHSRVVNVSGKLDAGKEHTYITLMLWKRSGEKWKKDELVPVNKIIDNKGSLKVFLKRDGIREIVY